MFDQDRLRNVWLWFVIVIIVLLLLSGFFYKSTNRSEKDYCLTAYKNQEARFVPAKCLKYFNN